MPAPVAFLAHDATMNEPTQVTPHVADCGAGGGGGGAPSRHCDEGSLESSGTGSYPGVGKQRGDSGGGTAQSMDVVELA